MCTAPGQQPILCLKDGFGNRISNVAGFVSAVIVKEQELIGDLKGQVTAQYREGGDAVFTDLSITPKIQDYNDFRLLFTSKGLLVTSAPIAIVSGPIYSIALETPLIGSVGNLEGGLLYPKVTVIVRDSGGGVVYGFDGSGCNGLECRISVRITKGPTCSDFGYTICTNDPLTGTTNLIATKGKVEFTDLRISAPGAYDLLFQTSTFGGRVPVKIGATNLQIAPAEVLAVVTQPGRVATGSVFRQQPTIKITDSAGNTILAAMHSVTVQIASSSTCIGLRSATQNRSSANPTMIAYVVAVRGIVTFTDLSIDLAPSSVCTLTFTMSIANNASQPFISVNSAPFSVVESGPNLLILAHPSAATGGVAFGIQPALVVKDKGGNIMFTDDTVKAVGLDSQGRQVPLIGRVEVPTYRGIANFTDLGTRVQQSSFSILFQCGNFWAISDAFDVNASNVSVLSILVQPSESSTTRKQSPSVELLATDAGGNTPLIRSTVLAELVPSTLVGCCSGCISSMDAQGRVSFPDLKITCVGRSMRLKFSAGGFSVVSAAFEIHGEPVSIEMHDFPTVKTEMVGNVLINSPAVLMLDASNMRATTIIKNVSVCLKSIQADGSHQATSTSSLRGTTSIETQSGVASFTDLSIISAARDFVLVFTLGNFEVVSEPFVVIHGPAVNIAISQMPNAIQFTGLPVVPFPTCVLYDIFGNLASSSATPVRACIAEAGGCASLSSGSVELLTDDVLPSSATATFSDINIAWMHKNASPGSLAAIRFYLSNQPNAAAISTPFQVFLNKQRLVISRQPSLSRVGQVMRVVPIVEIQDAGGYTFAQIPGGVSFLELNVTLGQTSSANAQLSRNGMICPCFVRFRKGIAEVDGLAIDTPGTFYSLQFSLLAMGISNAFSSQFSVSGLASLAYLHLQPPPSVVYGKYFGLILRIQDANHVPVLTDTVSAALVIADPSTCLEAQPPTMLGTISLAAPEGEAHFTDLRIDRAYPCKLQICFQLDSGATTIPHLRADGAGSVCTHDISAKHAEAHHLSLLIPIDTFTSSDLLVPRPLVSVVDEAGNTVVDFNGTIRAMLHDSNGSAIVLHSFEAPVIAGVAQLDVTVQSPDAHYRLEFEALQHGIIQNLRLLSNSFDVKPGPVTNLLVITQPGHGVAGLRLSVSAVVAAVDKGGNVATSFAGLVAASKSSGEAGGNSRLTGKIEAVAKHGLATFDGLSVNGSDTMFVILFTTNSSCAKQVASVPITVTANTTSFAQVLLAAGAQGGAAFATQPRFQALDDRSETAILTVGYVCARLAPWASAAGSLSGTTSAPFTNGFSLFTDLTLNTKSSYSLVYDFVFTTDTNAHDACMHGPFIGSINQTGLTVGTGQVARMQLDDPFPLITVTGGRSPPPPFLLSLPPRLCYFPLVLSPPLTHACFCERTCTNTHVRVREHEHVLMFTHRSTEHVHTYTCVWESTCSLTYTCASALSISL